VGLFTSSTPTAKFQQIGDSVVGHITHIGKQQRTEYLRDGGIGPRMYWSGGRPVAGAEVDPRSGENNEPVMDHVVTVDTGVADENGETGRRVFIKGKAELASIKAACIAAGVRDIEIGGVLKKIWVSGAGGTADPRVYEYKYKAPERNGGPQPASEVLPEVLERLKRSHENSPVLKRLERAPNPGFEEQIPF
jgi:hypothetical protein